MIREKAEDFLTEIKSINWFENSGSPNEKYHVVFSLYEACDRWGKQALDVWEPRICELEDTATEEIGDDGIDEVFEAVSNAIGDDVWKKFGEYIERQHLNEEAAVSFELFDDIKRDIAWACVEKVLDKPGFFTMLTEIYKQGYFPCSWDGEYPLGRAVVL